MTDWMGWLILAGVLIGLEIFTGTFYLLMIGIACAAGGVTALLGGDQARQLFSAAAIGASATILLRKKLNVGFVRSFFADPNVNLDIGQTIKVDQWHALGGGLFTSRASHRGSMWDVDLMPGSSPEPGMFVIREMRGSRLVVSNFSSDIRREEA